MIRSLFSKRPSPYYVVAPDYRRTSAGIRVMHMLCDALMRSGYEAYITAGVVDPRLMTPRLTDEIRERHQSQGVEPIVIYPEVIDGNPLAGNVVVRYLLNHPGFFGAVSPFEDSDILFSYTRGLLQPGMPDDRVMYMPAVDTTIFCLPTDSAIRIPGKICYYQGRNGQAPVDPQLLTPDAVEITLGSPGTWEELAALFQQCEYFYCTEASGLAAEAVLCGCVAIILPNRYAPRPLSQHENNNYGVAWGNTPENIQRARETAPLLLESLLTHRRAFWDSLDHFIEVTQQAADAYTQRPPVHQSQSWLAHRTPTAVQTQLIEQHTQEVTVPVLGIVILDACGDTLKLQRTLDSMAAQTSSAVSVRPMILTVATELPEGHKAFVLDEVDPVSSINQAVLTAECDAFMVVRSGETFTSSGLMSAALLIAEKPSWRALYADEGMRFADGRLDLLLRPDMNLDLLLSFPSSMTSHWLFNRDIWQQQGGFVSQYPDAFELEFILRLIELAGYEGLIHQSEAWLIGNALVMQDSVQHRQVIERHLHKRGFDGAAVASRWPGLYEVDYAHAGSATVSILIPVDGELAYAQRCVESLLGNTSHKEFELVLLDRGNEDPSVISWLTGIEQLAASFLRILRCPADTSIEAMYNQAADQTLSEFLVFMDPRIGVAGSDWLQQLLNHGRRPEVGCVAPKLVDSEGRISHAGLLLGQAEVVTNHFKGVPMTDAGYAHRLRVDQSYTALAGECLMLRRELFVAAGGFDEQMRPWSSVDLCLKLHQAGYLNVWTPRVQLLISRIETPPASVEQEDRLYERWLPALARDPASNANLLASSGGVFSYVDNALSWRPLASIKALPRVLVQLDKAGGNTGDRIKDPLEALNELGQIQGTLSSRLLSVTELERFEPDAIVLARTLGLEHLDALRRMKAFSRAFKVCDLDVYLPDLSASAPFKKKAPGDILAAMRHGLAYMDRLLVPTTFMAQVFEGFNADVRVLENRLAPTRWGALQGLRRQDGKPRIGWVGAVSDVSDLEMIAEVIKSLANEVHWVMLGACPVLLRPYIHEFHQAVGIEQYPAKLASLNLDLGVAPLEDNFFNRCKSNLRLLEFGACGVPVICSDVEAYRGQLPVRRVDNRPEAWVDAIRAHIDDLNAAAALGDFLQGSIRRDWLLDGSALAAWHDSWLGV
ncbi:Glycosyl transferases group 1 [Pseudomonas guariconensis]|uniref:Glycosyltransferase 2-like domain-containing protein n=1 Tax=Pseudomonas putida TaxID=303 RepID=A0A6S5TQ34_PSEPU|nr:MULTISPECIES: glycosyltransferase [Pseudomonas]BBT39276.1 hypothetical protein WP8W18C01_16170 [Pseudomonas putida]SDD45472.1 Glycosyl transferases group 1 [Pseudomonas guariconensis]